MGERIDAFDWSATPLGPISGWSHTLKTVVRVLTTSRYAMWMSWGPEFTFLYNDAYARATLGKRHPWALGRPSPEVWPEIWSDIGPRIERVMTTGEASWEEALLLILERSGFSEESYHTFSYSPITDDDGVVRGHLCVVTEETERVIGERRLDTLRQLAAEIATGTLEENVLAAVKKALESNQRDLPFTLTYLFEDGGKRARLATATGIEAGHPAAPEMISLDSDKKGRWPVGEFLQRKSALFVAELGERFENLPSGAWKKSPQSALLVPIAAQGQDAAAGVLVAGLNPFRPIDAAYTGFLDLVGGQIAGGIANARAYEEERKRAQALAELDRAKTKFFSNVSHEFRTPLTLILGPTEDALAAGKSLSGAELETVHRNELRLLKLVNTLLDFSRLEAGRVPANYAPTDLSQYTAELASVFEPAMAKAGLRFHIHCGALKQPVFVDREMWEKIVLNLLSNALKCTFKGNVDVVVRDANRGAELLVVDTGTGIPENELPHLFERFRRVENAQRRTHEGSGIGLALVHELVKLHGGSISVASRVGEGTTFTIRVPYGTQHLPKEQIVSSSQATAGVVREAFAVEALSWFPGEGESRSTRQAGSSTGSAATASPASRVLLAEDNRDMREYVSRLLQPRFQIATATNGREALEKVRTFHPDLVLSDVMMPEMDGFQLLAALRGNAETSSIPVILLSARAGEEAQVEGIQAGADDYLVKPFTARELIARVETHARLAGVRRQGAEREGHLLAAAELERKRLREVLHQAPAGMGLLHGPEHRWIFINDLYVRITGRRSMDDFLGKSLPESVPEIAGQGFVELLDEVYRTGKPFHGSEMKVTLHRGPGGSPEECYFNFVYQPILSLNGAVDGILVHAIEVTGQVRARRALEMNEQRLRLAQSAARIGTWEWEPDGGPPFLSDELHEMFGTSKSDANQAQVWATRVHSSDLPMVQQEMMAGYQRGSMDFEYRYMHPERGLRWFSCKGRRFQDTAKMFGTLQDVTDRKDSEEVRHRLAAIVQSSDDAIVGKDLRGIVTSWNKAAERIFGYTPEEMVGQSILKIIPPELHSDEQRILDTMNRGERIEHFETVRLRKNGERINVSLTISPVKDESGRIIGVAKIARDITQQKRAEQALRTTERLASVGRLAATVAHEINNPLEAVVNLVYLAKMSAGSAEARDYLNHAEEELARVSHITRQTLGFYRETRGVEPVKIAQLIDSVLAVFAPRIRSKNIEFLSEIRKNPQLLAVPGEMRELLANLVGNAVDAVGTGGTIRVRLNGCKVKRGSGTGASQVDGVRLTVADDGHGIPATVLPRLFEPFFTTKKDVGTGLGLWVCRSIVEKHGGSIRVKTHPTGKTWTVFSVTLPQRAEVSAEGEADSPLSRRAAS
jgi:PAS domain S-box-containing protein